MVTPPLPYHRVVGSPDPQPPAAAGAARRRPAARPRRRARGRVRAAGAAEPLGRNGPIPSAPPKWSEPDTPACAKTNLTTRGKGANICLIRTFVRLGSATFTRRGSRGQDRRAQPGRVDGRCLPHPGGPAARPGPGALSHTALPLPGGGLHPAGHRRGGQPERARRRRRPRPLGLPARAGRHPGPRPPQRLRPDHRAGDRLAGQVLDRAPARHAPPQPVRHAGRGRGGRLGRRLADPQRRPARGRHQGRAARPHRLGGGAPPGVAQPGRGGAAAAGRDRGRDQAVQHRRAGGATRRARAQRHAGRGQPGRARRPGRPVRRRADPAAAAHPLLEVVRGPPAVAHADRHRRARRRPARRQGERARVAAQERVRGQRLGGGPARPRAGVHRHLRARLRAAVRGRARRPGHDRRLRPDPAVPALPGRGVRPAAGLRRPPPPARPRPLPAGAAGRFGGGAGRGLAAVVRARTRGRDPARLRRVRRPAAGRFDLAGAGRLPARTLAEPPAPGSGLSPAGPAPTANGQRS